MTTTTVPSISVFFLPHVLLDRGTAGSLSRTLPHSCAPRYCLPSTGASLPLTIFDRRRSPVVGLLLRFIPGNAVAFLQSSDQLISGAGDQVKIVVRQPAPFCSCRSSHLLPFSFNAVPVHVWNLLSSWDLRIAT